MRILAIGDVVGSEGCSFLRAKLPSFKKEKNINIVIANGENSAQGNGILPYSANYLFSSGVDVITNGNHSFRRREIYPSFDQLDCLIRPANFPSSLTPGKGYCVLDLGYVQVCVINLMGTVYMDNLNCPFNTMDKILNEVEDIKIKILDFHAEATSEKKALGFYLDGKISAMFGTHTHIQTADELILPNGTGYITDLGMTGVINSVLGITIDTAIYKLRHKLPTRFESAKGDCNMDCVLFEIDENSGKTIHLERFKIK